MKPELMTRLVSGTTTRREALWGAGAAGAAIAGSSLLAACGGSDDSGSASGTITFWDQVWGGDQYGPTVKSLIAKYEKENPDVTIKYRLIPWANFFEVYNTAIVSGSTPKLAVAPTFPWKGSLAPPTTVIDQWKENGVYDDTIQAAIDDQKDAEGVITGLPWGTDTRVLAYRKDLFENAGVKIPTTLDELGQVARDLSKDGRYGLGFTGETLGSQMLYSLFLNNGGGLFNADCGPDMTSDRNAEVCEWIQAMVRDGAIPKAAAGWVPDDLTKAMNGGDIAMAINAPGWYSSLDEAVSKEVDIMSPLEGFQGDKGTIVYYLPVWTFRDAAEDKAAAHFLEWWLDNLPELFEKGQMAVLPARKSFYDKVPAYKDPRIKKVLDEWIPVAKPLAGECEADMLYVLSKVEGQGFLQTLTQDILTLKAVDESLQTAQDALAEIVDTA